MDTFDNALGLCAISSSEKPISKIICLPSTDKGSLKVLNYGKWLFKLKNNFIISNSCW